MSHIQIEQMRKIVVSLRSLGDDFGGLTQAVTRTDLIEPNLVVIQNPFKGIDNSVAGFFDTLEQRFAVGNSYLGGGRWCRGAKVGDEIGDGEIDLVAYG